MRLSEALSNSTLHELLAAAGRDRWATGEDSWVWVRDFNEGDGWVVFDVENDGDYTSYRVSFTLAEDPPGATLGDDAEEVVARTQYEAIAESVAVPGRIRESIGTGSDGGRIFEVTIIEAGLSRNGRFYDNDVLREATSLYEGAKAFDRHRTPLELATSTISGLVGHYENCRYLESEQAIVGDLHLLPSAAHTAEVLDASVDAQSRGLPPIVGISHDAGGPSVRVTEGGRVITHVKAIQTVNSADVVADPSAGGHANRIVAGGIGDTSTSKETPMDELKELLAKHQGGTLTDEERDTLSGLLDSELGMTLDDIKVNDPEPTTEEPEAEPAEEGELVGAGNAVESFQRTSTMGEIIVNAKLDKANLPQALRANIAQRIPESFTEQDLDALIEPAKALAPSLERGDLLSQGGRVTESTAVTKDEHDKKIERLDASMEGRLTEGYHSISQAFMDFNRHLEGRINPWDHDIASMVLREARMARPVIGEVPSLAMAADARITEAHTVSDFSTALGDSMHRRLVKEYRHDRYGSWTRIVSTRKTVRDFRSQKAERLGGFANLPIVAEGGAYTDPSDLPEDGEATYSVQKRGRQASLTLEVIKNDDISVLARIPTKLGQAAARTHRDYVWGLMTSNPTIYDAVALFAAGHNNTG